MRFSVLLTALRSGLVTEIVEEGDVWPGGKMKMSLYP